MRLQAHTAGTGTDLVLLHGWGMNAGVWQPVLEGLDRFHQRLPGEGRPGGQDVVDGLQVVVENPIECRLDVIRRDRRESGQARVIEKRIVHAAQPGGAKKR